MEQTVQKALRLLEALVRSGGPRRLTELARELDLTKPNVYRLLSTLSALGYAKKDPATSLYSATLRMWEMGSLMVRGRDVVSVAAPRLRRLGEETRETVQLSVFDAGFAVCVDSVEDARSPAIAAKVGSRVPAIASATGKALLAWLPADALDQAMRAAMPVGARRGDIERELAETRSRGYSLELRDVRAGSCGLAAPIRDLTGSVVAAVGIRGEEKAFTLMLREPMARQTLAAASDISRNLGYLEPAVAKAARIAVEETV